MPDKFCEFKPCDRRVTAKGLCPAHYQQMRKGGELKVIGLKPEKAPCSVDKCFALEVSLGYCGVHYRQSRSSIGITPVGEPRINPRFRKKCEAPNCERVASTKGACATHYCQMRKHGKYGAIRPVNKFSSGYFCTFESCERKRHVRGYCRPHYKMHLDGVALVHVPMRVASDPTDPGTWRSTVDRVGYVRLSCAGVVILQHRYVMEQHLGRKLLKHENVHHLNGVRHDNRISNLELWSSSQPPGQRALDKLAWAREMIALYEPIETNLEEQRARSRKFDGALDTAQEEA